MSTEFDPIRSTAIRDMLIVQARPAPRRRMLWAGALLATGVLVGAGASTAAFAASGGFHTTAPAPSASAAPAVSAPAGAVPGAPLETPLGRPRAVAVNHQVKLALDDRPLTATHVRITIVPLTPGTVFFGLDPIGTNNSSAGFDQSTVDRGSTAWSDFDLSQSTGPLYVTPTDGATATALVQYLHIVPTHLARNESGQTYGAEGGPDGSPDLISVIGTDPDGQDVQGYALASDLNAFSPDHPDLPSNPSEAVKLQAERDAKYPDGWEIPVFKSDGTTRIGTFHIG